MTYNLQLPEKVQALVALCAEEKGQKEDDVILEAILQYLEDMEDIRDAKASLQDSGKEWTLEEVKKELGLETKV